LFRRVKISILTIQTKKGLRNSFKSVKKNRYEKQKSEEMSNYTDFQGQTVLADKKASFLRLAKLEK
jgi:hypothetical protein